MNYRESTGCFFSFSLLPIHFLSLHSSTFKLSSLDGFGMSHFFLSLLLILNDTAIGVVDGSKGCPPSGKSISESGYGFFSLFFSLSLKVSLLSVDYLSGGMLLLIRSLILSLSEYVLLPLRIILSLSVYVPLNSLSSSFLS